MNTRALVEALVERQSHEGWSDREMGRQLGVDHTTWRRVRLGERGAGVLFLRRATARFPEYTGLLFVPVHVRAPNRDVIERDEAAA